MLSISDLTNYTLWNAQILATQGSMARCIIPDVLKLYEQCMKNMYNKNRYDEVMLSEYLLEAGNHHKLWVLIAQIQVLMKQKTFSLEYF